VADDVTELGTEGQAKAWTWVDPESRVTFSDDDVIRICGRRSLAAKIDPYSGGRINLLYPASKDAGWSVREGSQLVFWIKVQNENVPAWQGPNPVVTLHESDSRFISLTPKADLLSQRANNEEREGWSRFAVPLAGDANWVQRGEISRVNYITLGFDSWGTPAMNIWVDGMALQ
jgi:hypothetical protein